MSKYSPIQTHTSAGWEGKKGFLLPILNSMGNFGSKLGVFAKPMSPQIGYIYGWLQISKLNCKTYRPWECTSNSSPIKI